MNTHLKFDGPRLDELLERVGRELGPEAVIVEANRTRRGGVGGFFAREWFEVVVEATDLAAVAPRPGEPAEDPLLALADAVEDRVEPREVDRIDATPTPAAVDSFAGVLARVGGGASVESASPRVVPLRPSEVPTSAPDARPGPATTPSPGLLPPAAAAARVAPPAATRLRDLPLGEMLDHLDRMVPRTSLPATDAPIIAVVGDVRVARPVAASMAVRLGVGEADVMVATAQSRDEVAPWMLIDGAATARTRAARWRRGEQPIVVVVDLTPGRDGHAWAAELLAALDADQVRLVARAWQVTDELGPKATALGGVDGLELVELDAAAEPEAFLELDLPVLGIDGRAASSEMWAALLMERRNDATT